MTTVRDLAHARLAVDARSRSVESWRARLGALASRGETDGPRVAEAKAALSYWRRRTFLVNECDVSEAQADALLDLINQQTETAVAQ